jgi:hypothetical protein
LIQPFKVELYDSRFEVILKKDHGQRFVGFCHLSKNVSFLKIQSQLYR